VRFDSFLRPRTIG